MQAGFQTIALPLLIVVIMVVLVNYINIFIVKQRAKEFASDETELVDSIGCNIWKLLEAMKNYKLQR
jgi:hypothetical protein